MFNFNSLTESTALLNQIASEVGWLKAYNQLQEAWAAYRELVVCRSDRGMTLTQKAQDIFEFLFQTTIKHIFATNWLEAALTNTIEACRIAKLLIDFIYEQDLVLDPSDSDRFNCPSFHWGIFNFDLETNSGQDIWDLVQFN